MLRVTARQAALAAVLAGATALGACGESSQEKAQAQVCTARKDIAAQIAKLEGLAISTSIITEATASFEAMGKDITQIKNAQPNLEPARKEQVAAATKTFQSELSTITTGLASNLGSGGISALLKDAGPKLKSAVSTLASSYAKALGPISCP